jgi:hypothetical protein
MDLKIQPVGIDYVAQTWPFVETYLKEALEKGEPVPEWSDNYDISHVQGFLTSGLWTLLVATDDSWWSILQHGYKPICPAIIYVTLHAKCG